MTVDSLLRQAMAAVSAGQRDAALDFLTRVLQKEPRHPVALINRGSLLAGAGQLEEALICFQRVPQGHPLEADALCNAGYALRRLGRTHEALRCLNRALALKPRHGVALANRGLALCAQRQWEEACVALQTALELAPGNLDARNGLSRALIELDRRAEAMDIAERGLAMNPQHLGLLNARAYLLILEKRHEEALACLDTILRAEPAHMEALTNRGCALLALERVEESLSCLQEVLARDPEHVAALDNCGAALQRAGRHAEALACLELALRIDPDHNSALHNWASALAHLQRFEESLEALARIAGPLKPRSLRLKGQILLELNQHEEALVCLDAACAGDPADSSAALFRAICLEGLHRIDEAGSALDTVLPATAEIADSHKLRGVLLDRLCRRQEALESFDQALAHDPDCAEARYDRSLVLLALGRLEEGFREMEARWRMPRAQLPHLPSSAPLWLGGPIQGQTILIDGEQGLGDTLQFARYIPAIERLGAEVIFRASALLHSILSTLPCRLRVVSERGQAPEHDLRCPVMSLPLAFGTTLETIPAPIPYLRADPAMVEHWEQRLGRRTCPRIGLVWAGRQLSPVNHRRDMPLAALRPLLDLPADFISLQKDIPHADRETLDDLTGLNRLGEELTDFADTAALLQTLDLLIAVDTSVVHLAGAMGRPVWVMNRYAACWRWLQERSDSPWYPTARLFRQHSGGDWQSVITDVLQSAEIWLQQQPSPGDSLAVA